MNIFVWRDNEEYGPFSQSELLGCLIREEISNDDFARIEPDGEWQRVSDILWVPITDEHVPDMADEAAKPEADEPTETFSIWFNNEACGPYNRQDIIVAILRGELAEEDWVRPDDGGEWASPYEALNASRIGGSSIGDSIIRKGQQPVLVSLYERDPPAQSRPVTFSTRTIFALGALGMAAAFGVTCLVWWGTRPPGTFNEPQEAAYAAARNTSAIVSNTATPPDHIAASSPAASAVAGPQVKRPETNVEAVQRPTPLRLVGKSSASPAPSAVGVQKAKVLATNTVPFLTAPTRRIAVPSVSGTAKAIMWVADTVARPRAVLVMCVDPSQSPRVFVSDTTWQAYARENNLALAAIAFTTDTNAFPSPAIALRSQAADLITRATALQAKAKIAQTQANEWLSKSRNYWYLGKALTEKATTLGADANDMVTRAKTLSVEASLFGPGSGYYSADLGSGQLLLDAIGKTYGAELPMILYGRGGGALFTESFAGWKASRILYWGAYTDDWHLQAPAHGTDPPGVLACDCETLKPKSELLVKYGAARVAGARWTLAPLDNPASQRQPELDDFFRQYGKAILGDNTDSESTGTIVGIDAITQISAVEAMDDPTASTWLPVPGLQSPWLRITHQKPHLGEPIIVEREDRTQNPAQPRLHMYLRLPPGAVDARNVNGVVAYCTWERSEAAILGRLKADPNVGGLPSLLKFADDHNMAVLTWATIQAWDGSKSTEDMDRQKQEQLDKNFEYLANAWVRGVQGFGHDLGLPQRDFFLYGLSRGAQWAMHMALLRPEYFLAVHVHIPSTFDTPRAEARGPLWLVTTGEQEYGYEMAQRFYQECTALGYPIIFKATPNLGHADIQSEHDLGIKFFEYALTTRGAYDQWVENRGNQLLAWRSPTVATMPWLASFQRPAYYGDFLNQDYYPAQQADMIPVSLRVPLPTKELADLWNQ